MKWLFALFLLLMSDAALAQTTGAVNPSAAPAQPLVNEDVPPGGCMPIGLTVSGEIVFPIQCKEFIERHRGTIEEPKPTAVEEKAPAEQEKPASKQSEGVVPESSKPADKPVDTVPPPKVDGKAVEQKPAAAEEKTAVKQSEGEASQNSKSGSKPVEEIRSRKRVEHEPRGRAFSPNCFYYRSYDPESGFYRGYDGRRHYCR